MAGHQRASRPENGSRPARFNLPAPMRYPVIPMVRRAVVFGAAGQLGVELVRELQGSRLCRDRLGPHPGGYHRRPGGREGPGPVRCRSGLQLRGLQPGGCGREGAAGGLPGERPGGAQPGRRLPPGGRPPGPLFHRLRLRRPGAAIPMSKTIRRILWALTRSPNWPASCTPRPIWTASWWCALRASSVPAGWTPRAAISWR